MIIVPKISEFETSSENKTIRNDKDNKINEGTNTEIIDMIKMVDKSQIYNYLETFVNFGHKYTGNENCKKAGEYIYNEFKK